jgi:hypothetical protein
MNRPPPPNKELLAAFTMASTFKVVISVWMISMMLMFFQYFNEEIIFNAVNHCVDSII